MEKILKQHFLFFFSNFWHDRLMREVEYGVL